MRRKFVADFELRGDFSSFDEFYGHNVRTMTICARDEERAFELAHDILLASCSLELRLYDAHDNLLQREVRP